MIDKASYLSLVDGDLDGRSTEELESIVEKNPWFSLAHMALAKRYFDSNHSGYTDQLGKAAVYVGSPSILYDIIMQPEPTEAAEDGSQVEVEVEAQPQIIPAIEEPVAAETVEELEPIVEEVIEGLPQEEIEEVVEIQEDTTEEPVVIPEFDELETNLVVGAISDSIEKEVTPEPTVIKDDAPSGLDTSSLSSLSKWMLKRSGEVGFTSEPSSFKESEPVSSSPMDIIDRFIEANPKITPKKVSDYSTENLAKESLVEDETLITETMARIYAQQGKLEKAKRAYRLLGLKYPEKSVYFAAQLKKLGKKSN